MKEAQNTTLCPRNLAKRLLAEISGKAHPYMVYSKEEIPALREKTARGISKKAFSRMVATANGYLSRSGKLDPSLHPAIGRFFQSRFAYLSLTGAITGDEKYLDKATSIAVEAIESGNMEMYFNFNNALSVGDFAHAYALAYDLLYDRFTEEQRVALRNTMEELGQWIYTNSPIINTWGSEEPRRQAWNWNVIAHGALGLMALALGDHEDWLALAIERMLGYCRYAVDATGAAMEGLHYVGFALNTLTPFDLAVNRLVGIELMDAFPAMQALPYWSMHMTVPASGEQVAIGQGDGIGNFSATYYIINRYKQADALWGWLNTYNLLGDGEFLPEHEGNGWSIPALILFENQSLIPELPDGKQPLIRSFAKGIVTARDGWDKNASMATFTCGYGYGGCWNHPDDTSFTFYAGGESFIIDLGAHKKTSAEHNVISVDGEGMDYIAGPIMVIGKTEQNSILEGGELYLRGNNTDSYRKNAQLEKSVRHMIYGGGNNPFVILYDVAAKAGDHTYSVNFYTKADNAVTVSEDGKTARIMGKNGGATCFVTPFSPRGVALENTPSYNGISTSTAATDVHRQATVFLVTEDGKPPVVDFALTGDRMTVTLPFTENGERIEKTYVFTDDGLISPKTVSTEQPLPIPLDVHASIGQETATGGQ